MRDHRTEDCMRKICRHFSVRVGESKLSLEGETVWVVGGVGVIGRGICYGLLKAGATVIVNSSSEKRLKQMVDDLDKPKNLVAVKGTMRPAGADALVEEAMALTGNRIDHVVAHSGVRWWAGTHQLNETSFVDAILSAKQVTSAHLTGVDGTPNEHGLWHCEAKEFGLLPELHYEAARLLIPRLPDTSRASYTFVTGGAGEQRSIVSQVNTHGVWGLSSALRELYRDTPLRVSELRVSLKIDRPAAERALDPRARPLSADIGELCAGIATWDNALVPPRGMYNLKKYGDMLAMKMQYPCPEIVPEIPMLWHFDQK